MKTQVIWEAFQDPEASLDGGVSNSPLERWRGEEVGEDHIEINQDIYHHILPFSRPLSSSCPIALQWFSRILEV